MRVEGQADTGGSKWKGGFKLDHSFLKNMDNILVVGDVRWLFFSCPETLCGRTK